MIRSVKDLTSERRLLWKVRLTPEDIDAEIAATRRERRERGEQPREMTGIR
jgi:hypothetical protein